MNSTNAAYKITVEKSSSQNTIKYIKSIREYAKTRLGTLLQYRVIGQQDGVKHWRGFFLCHHQHRFSLDLHYDKIPMKWCPICESCIYLSEGCRKKTLEHDKKIEESLRKRQQRIFRQAKTDFKAVNCIPLTGSNSSTKYKQEEFSIEETHKDKSVREGKVSIEQAFAVLKILHAKRMGEDAWNLLQLDTPPFSRRPPYTKESLLKKAKCAFHVLAKKVHPDKNPHPKAADAMRIVHSAFSSILSNLSVS